MQMSKPELDTQVVVNANGVMIWIDHYYDPTGPMHFPIEGIDASVYSSTVMYYTLNIEDRYR